jgi:NADH dehydrogenase
MKKQQVVIVGGGFGGIKAALELSKDDRFKITLIADRDTFRYYPTLYHTATGGLKRQSNIPLRELFAGKSVNIVTGEAVTIDRKAHGVTLKDGRAYHYDIVILGLGVITNYFGIPGMEEFSYSIKSIEQSMRFKDHVHQQLTDEHAPDPHYVIVGAGPTGIELAGSLPQYIRKVMDKHEIRHRAVHVDLIEASPRLLPRMPKDYSRAVTRRLRRLGVKIYTGQAVQGLAADSLTVSGKPIRSHTVIWTAGVTNHPFFKENGFTLTNRGKVTTDMYLQADDNVYVIGDNANTPYSGMAQTALYDGAYVAKNLIRKANGKDPKGYGVKKPITVIPVGERYAAVLWGRTHIYGWLGWILRSAADFIGFRDYEPWWKATQQWATEFGAEETCPICLDRDIYA